jgi:hypothetical protein
MDAGDRELFARSVKGATATHTGAALDDALLDLGWHDALAADARVAVSILFECQGADNATSSTLDAVVLDALGIDAVGIEAVGTGGGGVVLPSLGQWRSPATRDGDCITIDGLALATRDRMLVVTHDGEGATVAMDGLDARAIRGLDPSLALMEVRGQVARAGVELRPVAWESAVVSAQRAIAHELIGASRQMLELARQHALERVQFGRPIAMFQAVRHRLSETLVAIETADAALDAAWIEHSPVTAAMAKALAGRGARTAARHCQQVLAGIGFTTEHPLHRYVRRVLVLDQMFGSSKLLTKELGEQLLAARRLPALLPL